MNFFWRKSPLKEIAITFFCKRAFKQSCSGRVNTQNIKEDYHNQVQEYYANYNLFGGNQTEHFEDFHENYASQTENPTQLNDPNQKVSVANPQQNTQVNEKKKKIFSLAFLWWRIDRSTLEGSKAEFEANKHPEFSVTPN